MPLNRFYTAAFILAAIAAIIVFSVLAGYPDPPGTDGYYYLKQIQVLSSGGGYYYKDRSLAFFVPAFAAWTTGNPLGAYRFAVALTCSLLILSGGLLAYRTAVESGLEKPAVIILSLATITALGCSLSIYEFVFEYYKNAFAILLLSAAAWISLADVNISRTKILAAVVLALGALFSHKSALFFCILFGVIWFLRNASGKNLLILASICVSGIAIFLLVFERGRQYLSALPSFFASPRRWYEWFSFTVRNDIGLSAAMAAAISSLVLYFFLRRRFSGPSRLVFDTVAIAVIIGFMPFLMPGPSGPGYRILLFSPLFTVPLLLACSTASRNILVSTATVLVAAFLAQMAIGHSRIGRHFPAWSSLDRDVMRITRHINLNDHLIAHHGLEFYVDYRTGIRARQFLSSDPGKSSFRLAYLPEGRPGGDARTALERVKLEQIGDRYALFREEDWQRLSADYGIRPHWKNPAMLRPDYIPDYD